MNEEQTLKAEEYRDSQREDGLSAICEKHIEVPVYKDINGKYSYCTLGGAIMRNKGKESGCKIKIIGGEYDR